MSRRRSPLRATRIRRAVQGIFLLAFVGLLLMARPRPGSEPSRVWQAFFLLDPLILLATWLAAHAVVWAALWALGLIAGFFLVTLALHAYRPRFWCRYLRSLGALLGVFAWRPLLRRQVAEGSCNQCELCGMSCRGAAAVSAGGRWKPAECLGCLNCTDSCARGAVGFQWVRPWRRQPAMAGVGIARRAVLGAAVGGLAALPLMRLGPQARGKRYNPDLVRPPGARPEKGFLARCTASGLCMKVCPTGGLQPALAEAGLEGIWTPCLVPRIGYCEYSYNLCRQVGPTQAIEPLPVEQKQKVRIGLASFDSTRCIPYAYGRNCMACEEHCPIPHKAIYTLEVEIVDRHGQRATIQQSHVDPELCIGCGACENVCPFKDRPAIRVTSANETRHPENQPILPEESPYESSA